MNDLRSSGFVASDKMSVMFPSLRHLIGWMISAFCSRQDLILENLALRQQLRAEFREEISTFLLRHCGLLPLPRAAQCNALVLDGIGTHHRVKCG
jgi:hypothetical protein